MSCRLLLQLRAGVLQDAFHRVVEQGILKERGWRNSRSESQQQGFPSLLAASMAARVLELEDSRDQSPLETSSWSLMV